MSNSSKGHEVSKIINNATHQIIEQTENFIKTVNDSTEDDAVNVTMNGKVIKLNKSDYEELKGQNKQIHDQMKAKIKKLVEDRKSKDSN